MIFLTVSIIFRHCLVNYIEKISVRIKNQESVRIKNQESRIGKDQESRIGKSNSSKYICYMFFIKFKFYFILII